MNVDQYIPKKIDLTPKRHHGFYVLLFIFGMVFPPIAVAARFGIGGDFFLNLILTICGYIPGHGHNFYIQNIRNNKGKARTPKWLAKYGLVDTSDQKKREKRSQWASRYNERNPHSTLESAPYEEGQEAGSSVDLSNEGHVRPQATGDLWREEEENFYNADRTNTSQRWHYPANFDDAMVAAPSSGSLKHKKKRKDKKDRWARTEDAHLDAETHSRKKSKKSKKNRGSVATESIASSRESVNQFPEDAEGGLYGERRTGNGTTPPANKTTTDDVFSHQF